MTLQPPSKKTCRDTTPPAWQQQQLLPDEVIEDILMRLPARSVARCRCLSRAWAAVLSSRGFINRHLDLATLPTTSSSSWRRLIFFHEHHLPGDRLSRSCRGLVLVQNYSTGLCYVCNPSTGQAASLPHVMPVKTDGGGYASFGLGHDARADRHKVVRLYYPVGLPAGCEVYDVGVSSKGYWRPAASGAKPPCFAVDRSSISKINMAGVCAQGRVHWLATSRWPTQSMSANARPDSVMSFSLADETFTSIPLPPDACGGRSLGLTVLHGGRLGLVSFYRHRARAIWTPAPPCQDDHAWRRAADVQNPAGSGSGCRDPPQPPHLWSQLATVVGQVVGSGYDCVDLYEESLEPVGRPFEDVLFASTSHLQALSMALRRLPAHTLGRLKSVCRSWRAVIESDRFASAHNEHHRRLAASPSSSLADRVIFTSCPPREDEPAVQLRSCLASGFEMMPPPLMDRRVVVSKPCHGLAQVVTNRCRGWGDRTELFNPVTRAHRIFIMYDDVHRSLDMSSGSIGLGYDPSRQEHVLVLLAADTECMVWRLGEADDGIRRARTVPAPPITPRFQPSASAVPPVYIDGRIHWMCCSPRAILAFCVRAGAFHVVPAPPPPGPATGGGHDGADTSGSGTVTEFLVELRRQLCVVQSCPSTETITIWSAAAGAGGRDDGAWSREYVIQLGRWPEFSPKTVELVVPMAIDATDGRILLDTGSSLGYYDPVQGTLETVYSLDARSYEQDFLSAVYSLYLPYLKKPLKRFFAAALWEESLVRPYDRCYRSWC